MSPQDRQECKDLIAEATQGGARRRKAAEILGVSIRTIERWKTRWEDSRKGPKTKPSNALTTQERAEVLQLANHLDFADLTPWQIVPRLADQGTYIASESSFYRILKAENCLAHRSRAQPRQHQKPEALTATAPNQVWSWDIIYLRAEVRGIFYYLYLTMDIFSRKIVHWEIHESESAKLASQMITKACQLQGIQPDQIKLHSDNGSPMKGATMLATLQWLGVVPSFGRPSVSDDNPYSEALFRTLKYAPNFPLHGRFTSLEAAKQWVSKFVHWYNFVHLHSAINWVTPASRHESRDLIILQKRKGVYEAARNKNPNRWSQSSRDWSRLNIVELNSGRKSKKLNKSHSDSIAS